MRVLSVFSFFILVILQICEGLQTSQYGSIGYQGYGHSVSVNFGLKFRYCRFVCLEKCGSTSKRSTDPVEEKSIIPEGFFWRDFYGMIPPDAYILGDSSQKPQTYMGLVYDPAHNGTFVTTIFDGTPYVYNPFKGKTFKLTENIKILCTLQPHRLVWTKLTQEILDKLREKADRKNVVGGYHVELTKENRTEYIPHYIVKYASKTTYVGYASKLNDTMEYAKQDGTVGSTKNFEWLMYLNKEPGNETMQMKRLCSHSFEFSYKLGSIPNFYRRINWASCTYTCSEGDQTEINKFKTNKRLKASMEYYWKPKIAFNKEDAFKAGYSQIYPQLYIGQSFLDPDIFDVGYALEYSTYLKRGSGYIIGEGIIYNVFSTTYPDKFEWINTTSTDFSNLDKDRMIPGGSLANGTKTYVGREIPTKETYPGSIHETKDGAFLISFNNKPLEFQVLMLKEEK
ncbi:uncharacterized protein LOC123680434 [Harmonia axyridis]|uniref:uncharacterized protein LOC123680434 n=1 Tax=Harmonia axyridis TaxID=115357 RepID=UPI001E2770C0|nr:uncharacterized protein LOC123680434 [Harmonia axyridis]